MNSQRVSRAMEFYLEVFVQSISQTRKWGGGLR